jgi:hypothetical protein
MATDIVGGLFGITPEMYQQNVGENILQQGVQMGQLAPDAFGRANVYAGAAQLGRGISGVMGVQDPQLKLISARNAIFSRTDPNDPESLARAASELAPFDPQGANALANSAREAAFKLSQVTKNLRERQGAEPIQQLLRSGKYTAESVKEYEQTGDISKLKELEKAINPYVDKVGIAKGTEETVYMDKRNDQQYVLRTDATGKQVRVPYSGALDQTTSKTNLSVSQKQEEEFSKRRGFTQANAIDEASNLARGGSLALGSIASMKEQDASGQLFTGPLANSYVGATNLLASVGLLSKEQTGKLTSSQIYDKSAKDLVMQDLGGKLGAQISDADRKFVEDRIPQLTTSQKARTELLNKLEEIQRGKIDYYKKMNAHANEFKNLNTFDFSEKYSGKLTTSTQNPDDLVNKYLNKPNK